MGQVNWAVTISLNLFRGFVSGGVFLLFAPPPPAGFVPTLIMMTIFGPLLLFAIRYVLMRIAMVIPFGLILQWVALIATGAPLIVADVVVWLLLKLMPNTFPLSEYNPFSMAAFIIVYEGGVSEDLGFKLPASWRRGV